MSAQPALNLDNPLLQQALPSEGWSAALMRLFRPENLAMQVAGSAEIEVPNDEAWVTFMVEVQDADARRAQTQVGQRSSAGVAALKGVDQTAQVESTGLVTDPIFDTGGRVIAWRVRQAVRLRTSNFDALARTVAQGQETMTLSAVDFRLSQKSRQAVQPELIRRAMDDLYGRAATIAQAFKISPERLRLEDLSFGSDPSGRSSPIALRRGAVGPGEAPPPLPTLDPGTTVVYQPVTARLRFGP
ncbi:MAG: SIMPL domain-containing protein [Betaproteobacteria bacterium]